LNALSAAPLKSIESDFALDSSVFSKGQFKSLSTQDKESTFGTEMAFASKVGLLVRATWASARTLRYARIVYLAANDIVGIALLEPL
jgi:hypothetical protein